MTSLDSQVVFITGAAREIGAEVARRLHAKGARLVLTDLDELALTALGAELTATASRGRRQRSPTCATFLPCRPRPTRRSNASVGSMSLWPMRASPATARSWKVHPGSVPARDGHQHRRCFPHRARDAARSDKTSRLRVDRFLDGRIRRSPQVWRRTTRQRLAWSTWPMRYDSRSLTAAKGSDRRIWDGLTPRLSETRRMIFRRFARRRRPSPGSPRTGPPPLTPAPPAFVKGKIEAGRIASTVRPGSGCSVGPRRFCAVPWVILRCANPRRNSFPRWTPRSAALGRSTSARTEALEKR